MDESEVREHFEREWNKRQNNIMWKECSDAMNSRIYELLISYLSLCQTMRKKKLI
jgi:hypothetical protein